MACVTWAALVSSLPTVVWERKGIRRPEGLGWMGSASAAGGTLVTTKASGTKRVPWWMLAWVQPSGSPNSEGMLAEAILSPPGFLSLKPQAWLILRKEKV